MEDRDFFQLLYQTWSKTTWAKDAFWKYTEVEPGTYVIDAVSQERGEKFVASLDRDEDADFITAVHGSLPDLIRCLLAALDEAERLDVLADQRTEQIAELVQEVEHYREQAEYWKDHK